MARKKTAAPKHVEPEEEGPEGEEGGGQEGHGIISKAEAIRRMLAEGIENPSVASAEIRTRFGIDVTPQHFSATKSQMKSREAAKKGKPGRKPKAAPSQAVEGYLAPPPKPSTDGEQPDLLAAIEAMKPLVEALGKEKAHRIVDLLG
jgi:hypothetical protein